MTYQVYLSAHAQRDLDRCSDKIAKQILADCARLADDPIPDGKRIKKLQGMRVPCIDCERETIESFSHDQEPESTSCAC
ncbi:hypothetical protein W02_06130 [Nitrospira sp. KM1]|uniref:type II toxin-antitoxin system RelE family toxin n=1 Tax=Nitrospira sp. KM1 TaxID=1936990 RepID=UPI0013A7958A|nr:hypothetical protein [Nitrospira sp. KM1]BCA53473.1 hypothetical protein W02_06130 [Nitrospira sp. KM1]